MTSKKIKKTQRQTRNDSTFKSKMHRDVLLLFLLFRPHRMHGLIRCGLLLHLSQGLCAAVCVYLLGREHELEGHNHKR